MRYAIVVSRSGYIFAVVSGLVLMAAWNTGENLFYLIVGALLTFLILSPLLAWMNLRRLRLKRDAPDAVHRGAIANINLEISNDKLILPSVSIRVESGTHPGESAAYLFKIPARRTGVVNVRETFDRRGVYPLPDVRLVTTFPFGLVLCRRRFSDSQTITVYPRVHSVRTTALDHRQSSGEISKTARGPGDEFHSLRDYVAGDDLRRIAWRVSARLGTLVVKELERETSQFIVFILDTNPYEELEDYDERFEEAVELVASLAVTMLARQFSVSVVTASDYVPEGEGTSQVIRILEMLARVQPERERAPDPATRIGSVDENRRGTYFYISPSPSQWGRIHGRGGMRVVDPREVVHA